MTNKQEYTIYAQVRRPMILNSHFAYKQSIIPFSRSNYTTNKAIAWVYAKKKCYWVKVEGFSPSYSANKLVEK